MQTCHIDFNNYNVAQFSSVNTLFKYAKIVIKLISHPIPNKMLPFKHLILIIPLIITDTQALFETSVTVYPAIDHPAFEYTGEEDYSVTITGGNVLPVRKYGWSSNAVRNYYHTHFGFSGGPVEIEVDAKEEIHTWSVSPKSYGIQTTVDGSKLRFSQDMHRYLVIMINGSPSGSHDGMMPQS